MFDPGKAPRLETSRLILRGWKAEDFAPFAAMMAEPEVSRFLTVDGRPLDAATAWRSLAVFVGHWSLRGFGLFAVEEKASGQFVGRVGPWRPEGWPGLELGWGLSRAHWGKGYAFEAARAAGDWAFNTLEADHLISLIHADNIASQNLATRLGEKPHAHTIHAGMAHTIWRITQTEWRAVQGSNGQGSKGQSSNGQSS
ncbi:MAG: GNAT family N-acetyltransferase [Hyphomonadaceae bacterium]